MSMTTTRGIKISVNPKFESKESNVQAGVFVYSYQIRIANEGSDVVQLMSRHWIITDGLGKVEHVEGPGVVGKQPILKPGEAFEYSSFCPLQTPTGSMRGSFQMRTQSDQLFDAEITEFYLRDQNLVN